MTNEDLIKKYVPLDKQAYALDKLSRGIPVQYIIGNVDFFGYEFLVNEDVLIPRFETEGLVEKTIGYIQKMCFKNFSIADLGTGSGCIGITLNLEIGAYVSCFDISPKAIEIARYNAKNLGSNAEFFEFDILNKISGKYDVIISNPPYIAYDGEVDKIVVDNEPHLALFADNDGLIFYEKIMSYAQSVLNEKFLIAFEIGCDQQKSLEKIANLFFPSSKIVFEQDLCGKTRYMFIFNE